MTMSAKYAYEAVVSLWTDERKPEAKVLRTRATGKKVDYDALLKRAMRRYPKTLERLAK